jgi:hypothetical protein
MAQGDLRPVVEAVRRYGEAHPGIVQQIWFEDHPERVVALLASDDIDIAIHESAIGDLVAAPEQIELRHSEWPAGHLERVYEEVKEHARHSISEIGLGKGLLHVSLWADQIDMAASLYRRYGTAIGLTLGFLPYPDIDSNNSEEIAIETEPPQRRPEPLPDEVVLSIAENRGIRSGSHFNTALSIHNGSAMEFTVGKLVPSVVDQISGEVVGRYEGAMKMDLRHYQVAAGTSGEVPILIGTASVRRELGWAVPPGSWDIRVACGLGDRAFHRRIPIKVIT